MELGLAYLVVAITVTLVVEVIRERLAFLDGRLVNLLAWAVGFAATYVPIAAFATATDIEARLGAGLLLAGGSSLIAELKGALTNTKALKKAALEALGKADEAFPSSSHEEPAPVKYDEGYNPDDIVKVQTLKSTPKKPKA